MNARSRFFKLVGLTLCLMFLWNTAAWATCEACAGLGNGMNPGTAAEPFRLITSASPDYESTVQNPEIAALADDYAVDLMSGIVLAAGDARYYLFPSNKDSHTALSYNPATGEIKIQIQPFAADFIKMASTRVAAADACTDYIICMAITYFIAFGSLFTPCLLLYIFTCL